LTLELSRDSMTPAMRRPLRGSPPSRSGSRFDDGYATVPWDLAEQARERA
jgi:hypothetical protein